MNFDEDPQMIRQSQPLRVSVALDRREKENSLEATKLNLKAALSLLLVQSS